MTLSDYAPLYRRALLEDVMPFWMRHALGSEDGAINNCLDDAGSLTSTDRFLWSQGRALWTFSALYNRIERRSEWMDAARRIAAYLAMNGRDETGRWMYRLDSHGRVLQSDDSLYVDGFIMTGLGEYFTATGDREAADLAVATWKRTWERIQTPGSYRIAPYEISAGSKVMGIRMLFSFVFCGLGEILGRDDIRETGLQLADELLADFWDEKKQLYREFVSVKGGMLDSPEGRVCIPGHVIEGMWFLISIFERDPGRRGLIPRCCQNIRRHLELGWDAEYGGLRLALDVEGREPVAWSQADCKPWWAQVEALVATAYAHLHTGEDWCMEWHEKIREFAFGNYPVFTGEWTQWLDRKGHKTKSAALPVKDPFHLPRALIYLCDLFGRRIPEMGRRRDQ
jgi:N-acylglucosamine 2-epimerase